VLGGHSGTLRRCIDSTELLSLCRAKVLVALAVPLLLVLFIAIGCGAYEHVRTHDHPARPALADLDLTFAYSLCGFALSLLLVFKTNTAYARYWEGTPLRT
jgi:predicted membrane chloride channel (bestrophin family)